MLENCLSGSEGGGAIALPTPIIGTGLVAVCRRIRGQVEENGLSHALQEAPENQCRIGLQPVSCLSRATHPNFQPSPIVFAAVL
jgi:hypothetical protein